jgi:large repetitive protein
MTADRDLDRQLASWLDERATLHVPDGLLERSLGRVGATRQRPGWLVPDAWRSPRAPGRPATPARTRGLLLDRLAVAAVIGVIAVGGALYLIKPTQPAVGGPSSTLGVSASPRSASPSASPSPSVVQPRPASWTPTGSMVTPREGHTATLLPDGKVLVAGGLDRTTDDPNGLAADALLASAELYDPSSGTWSGTGNMGTARENHTATLLANGKVLVAGGTGNVLMTGGSRGDLASAELYDPATGTWTATGNMTRPRGGAVATLLPNGKVLVVGGAVMYKNGNSLSESSTDFAELYDPASGTWTATGKTVFDSGRGVAATLLPDGKVLVAGAVAELYDGKVIVAGGVSELYDPGSGTWSATGNRNTARGGSMATLLPNGKVLMACGCDQAGRASELYDPTTGSWTATGTMVADHLRATATMLPDGMVTATLLADGKVLVAGGGSPTLPAAEVYNPGTGSWTATVKMLAVRLNHTATLLPDGNVLVVGGGDRLLTLASAELYDPGIGTP